MLNDILLPLDGSSLAECVLPHAVAIAQACGSKIVLLHVLESADTSSISSYTDPFEWQVGKYQVNHYLKKVTERLGQAGLEVEAYVVEGKPAESILTFAGTHPDGLILLSSHGRSGLSGWTSSSVAQKVALRAHVSVMVVPAYNPCTDKPIDTLHYRRILVPIDGSARANYVLSFAKTIAHAHGSELLLMHVLSCPEMPGKGPLSQDEIHLANRIIERNREEAWCYLEEIRSWLELDTKVRLCLVTGHSVPACLHAATEQYRVDLVILNAHGYSGSSRRPYGSVALHFLFYGTKPQLVIQDLPADRIDPTRAEFVAHVRAGEFRKLHVLPL